MYRAILCAAAGAVIFAMPAKADETLKFRFVQYAATAQIQEIGDVPNHKRRRGLNVKCLPLLML
jgi:hypothetical protein